MGIREQIIYYTPDGSLKPYLTFSFFPKQPVSSWKIHEQVGEKGGQNLAGKMGGVRPAR